MNASKITPFLLLLCLVGCASANTYQRIEAEGMTVYQSENGEKPSGVVEDAMRRDESFPLFDQITYKKIEQAIKSTKDLATAHKQIRDVICNGTRAKVAPKITVRLILSKPNKGEPLDVVSRRNQVFISGIEFYLKNYWLMNGSDLRLNGVKYNQDYSEYKERMVDTDMERRTASSRISVGVPFLNGSSVKEVETYFANARATPSLKAREEVFDLTQWFPDRHILSVAFPKERYVVLSSKTSNFLLGVWGYETYGTEMKTEVVNGVQLTPETYFTYFGLSDGDNYRNRSHYTISKNKWRLKDGTVIQPLVMSYIDDLAMLKSEWTFSIPKADLEKLFNVTESRHLKYFGYDFSTGKFSPRLAVENSDYMWSRILGNQTEVIEANKEPGSIEFQIKPSFEGFCKWAVPKSSLVSE